MNKVLGYIQSTTIHPYQGQNASQGSSPQVTITYGTHNNFVPSINGTLLNVDYTKNILTLDGGNGIVYIELDFDTDSNIINAEINSSSSSTPPNDVINTDGSATGYQILFAYYITYSNQGNAIVTISQNVGGSQAVQICGASVLYGLI